MSRALHLAGPLIGVCLLVLGGACDDAFTAKGSGGGGSSAQGGNAQGGNAQGGTAQGGNAQGGTAQGGSAQGGSGGGQRFDDGGLLLRYFFDEPTSAAPLTDAQDSAGTPLAPLSQFDAVGSALGSFTYDGAAGSRGLQWSSLNQLEAMAAPTPSKIHGAQSALTVEVVTEILATRDVDTALASFGYDGTSGADVMSLVVKDFTAGRLVALRTRNDAVRLEWNILGAPNAQKTVFHFVIDLGAAADADTYVLYSNGLRVAGPSVSGSDIAKKRDALQFDATGSLFIGNTRDGLRNILGTINYFAVYKEAFDAARVQSHRSALNFSDDG